VPRWIPLALMPGTALDRSTPVERLRACARRDAS
jgi:hypothetical protein